jgi:predicted RNA-binding Zn-ribbon protein involved in translation (DUF1610 family)
MGFMSTSVICHGCGTRLPVGDEPRRKKIRCPECGVMCEVAATASAPPARRPPKTEGPPPPPPLEDAPPLAKELVTCQHCGETVRGAAARGKPGKCPNCGATMEKPSTAIRATRPEKPKPAAAMVPEEASPLALADTSDEDDGKPYQVTGANDIRLCPGCKKQLSADVVLCPSCGFDRNTGKKTTKVYEPLERQWEAGWPLRRRVTVFVAADVIAVLTGGLATYLNEGDVSLLLIALVFFNGMLAFLLGTYNQLYVSRNERGKVKLRKTWRICFIPQTPINYDLRHFEGIVTGQTRDVDIWDWLMLFLLLLWGIAPGIIWWYYGVFLDSFFVALSKDHGYPAEMLYRGWSKERMEEIAHAVRDATGLPDTA